MSSRRSSCTRSGTSSSFSDCSDNALISAIQDGDKAAFAELVGRHLDRVWRVARNMLGDDAYAEDVAQEVFLSVWRARDSWRPDGAKFTTWLYKVSINKCIDFTRRKGMASAQLSEDIVDQQATDAQKDLERQQQATVLLRAIAALPESQRLAITLYYYEELDVRRIAHELQNTEQGVRSLLKRGRQNLRHHLQIQKDLWHDTERTDGTGTGLRRGSLSVA